jgi:hypothetical protein
VCCRDEYFLIALRITLFMFTFLEDEDSPLFDETHQEFLLALYTYTV